MIRFPQKSRMPLIVAGDVDPGHWYGLSLLNSGAVIFGGNVHLYYRGPVGTNDNYHAIGCMTQPVVGFDPHDRTRWTDHGIVLQPTDVAGVSGPMQRLTNTSAVVFGGKVRLYFNVKQSTTFLQHTASSVDGLTFVDEGPCLIGGAPFGGGGVGVCLVGSTLWQMFGNTSASLGFEMAVAKSTDGVAWTNYTDSVITPDGGDGFTGYSMVTSRLVFEDPWVYAFVPSGAVFPDYPEAVGVWRAHKSNHAAWEAFPRNPVWLRNSAGRQDEGAVWSFTVLEVNGRRYAFYEGVGSRGLADSAASNGARDDDYYNYNVDSFSQVFACEQEGHATLTEAWASAEAATPLGPCYLRNMKSLGYLAPLGGAFADGTQLAAYLARTAPGTLWSVSLDGGLFRFTGSSKVVGVAGGSRATGATITLNAVAAAPNPQQEWHLIQVGAARADGGLYRIQNRRSGMFLSLEQTASGDAQLVSQRAFDGSASQIWLMQPAK